MPSGPKKRRAARRKRGSSTDPTDDEFDGASVNNVSEMSYGDTKVEAADVTSSKEYSKSVDQIALKLPPPLQDVPVVNQCDSVESNGKKEDEHEAVHDEIVKHAPVMESVISMVESVDSVGNKAKESVDQILIQQSSKETKGNEEGEVGEGAFHGGMEMVDHGFSVEKESEEISKEGVLEDPFEDPSVRSSHQSQAIMVTPLQEAQDLYLPIDSVSEVNVETFNEDAQDSLKELSAIHENEGVEVGESAFVKDVSVVKNEGEDEDPSEERKESSSYEFDQSILKNIRVKEADHIPTESVDSVIEVDVDAISFEDAQDSFETPLGSPSKGYMSQVIIPLSELAQDPYVAVESIDEVNRQKSLKEDQDSFTEPRGISSLVEEIKVVEGGESESHDSPHVEPILKVDEYISVEGVVQGNECGVGECTCDCPLINHAMSEGEKMSLESVCQDPFQKPTRNSSYDPQEMFDNIDMSPIESFVQINGHGNEPFGLSSHEQQDDVISVEGVVPGNECAEIGKGAFNHVLVSKEDEEMPIEGVLEELNGSSSDEPQVMIKAFDQEIPLKEDQDPYIPGDSISEANVEASLKDAQVYSFKVSPVEGNKYEEVGESATLVNPFVLGIEEDDDDEEEMSIESVIEETFKDPTESSSDELQAMVKVVDNSVLEVIPSKDDEDLSVQVESLSEANVDTSLKEPRKDSSMDDVSCMDHGQEVMDNHVESVMKENEDMSMEDVLEESISSSSDEPQPMVKRVDEDLSTQAKSVIEVNVDASFELAQDSFKVPLGDSSKDDVSHVEGVVQGNKFVEGDQSASHGQDSFKDKGHESAAIVNQAELVMEENEEMSIEGVPEESFEGLIERSSNEPELIVKTIDQSIMKEAQHPSSEAESESVIDVLPTEGIVEGNEVDESACHGSLDMVNHVVPVLKDDDGEIMSTESVLQDPTEEYSLHEPQEIVKTIDQLFLKGLHSKEVHNPLVIEVNVDTSSEDSQDSFETPLGSPSVGHVSPNEDFAQWNGDRNESTIEENVETLLKDAKDSPIESLGSFSLVEVSSMEGVHEINHGLSDLKDEKEVSMEGVLEERFEKQVGDSSHEQEAMVDTIDRSLLKEIPLKEVEDLATPVESVTGVNVDTPFKDSQDSLKETLGSPSLDDVSPLEGVVQGNEFGEIGENVSHIVLAMKEGEEISIEGVVQDPLEEPIGSSYHELEEIVKTYDQLETQLPSLQVDSVMEVIKDVQDSFETPPGSPSASHVSPVEGLAEWNEPIGYASHEPHVIAKTDDQVVSKVIPMDESLEPSLPVESVIEANVEEPLKDDEDHSSMESLGRFSMADVSYMKGVVQGNEGTEADEKSFHEEVASMEGVVDKLQTMVKKDDQSFQDPFVHGYVQEKEFAEGSENAMVNHVEKIVGDSSHEQEATVIESPSLVDVFPVEGNEFNKVSESACHGSLTIVNHEESVMKESKEISLESSSMVNGSPVEGVGQQNGQRSEMLGLVRTLLEEIRRIRAFYEEGLRQTTKIDLQMLEILEKFD